MNSRVEHPDRFVWRDGELETDITAQRLPHWVAGACKEFKLKVLDASFPCTFGTIAQRKGDVLFGFSESAEIEPCVARLQLTLIDFTRILSSISKVAASMMPLAFFMPPEQLTVEEYFTKGWQMLQRLHDSDPAPWPPEVPTDPDDRRWSFCFNGMPLFINFKTPAHQHRRSRHFGHAYVWLVQAREGFDVLAGDTVQGRRARGIIRDKLSAYDGMEIYSALAHYGTPANREWQQYFVPDTEEEPPQRCPFRSRPADPKQGKPFG